MKSSSANSLSSFRLAIRNASRAARRKAFRRGLPVAISKNGQVVFVYKNKREVIVSSSPTVKSK